ncbi:MAG: hypothetical protein K2Y51_09300 [Gammaproteobacteria bacterium]|nr:hypothetical protein [Gammaproteobacteria bacterium]
MRLSFALGVPVRRLQCELTAAEFAEYAAFMAIEPQGGTRLDFWGARLLAALAALGGQRTRPADHLPRWWRVNERRAGTATTPGAMAAVFAMFADAHNKMVKRQ